MNLFCFDIFAKSLNRLYYHDANKVRWWTLVLKLMKWFPFCYSGVHLYRTHVGERLKGSKKHSRVRNRSLQWTQSHLLKQHMKMDQVFWCITSGWPSLGSSRVWMDGDECLVIIQHDHHIYPKPNSSLGLVQSSCPDDMEQKTMAITCISTSHRRSLLFPSHYKCRV